MLKHETVNQQCYSCHAEKRGPYVFSHPPVDENCLSCHNPHGSSHTFLLNEKVPNVCQDCHDWSRHPGSFYGGQHAWTTAVGNAELGREHAVHRAVVRQLPQRGARQQRAGQPRQVPDPLIARGTPCEGISSRS